MMFKKRKPKIFITLIFIITILGCGSSKGLHFLAMPQYLTLTSSNYSLIINRSPFGFTVTSNNVPVFASIPCTNTTLSDATGNYDMNGKAGCVFSASGYNTITNGTIVYLQGSNTGLISYTFSLLNDMIKIDISAQNSNVTGVGDSFSVGTAGHWYGQGEVGNYIDPISGNSQAGAQWFPLENGSFTRCPLQTGDQNNIITPLWLTSNGAGLFVDSYGPMCVSLDNIMFSITSTTNNFSYYILVDKNIPSTYKDWISTNFTYKKAWQPVPIPAPQMFQGPVWSTWAEYPLFNVNQSNVLSLAQDIKSLGFTYSVLEIDDTWQPAWGDTDFDKTKFPDPASMITQLHDMGFKVSLWVPPFVNDNSSNFNTSTKKYFIQSASGGVSLVGWWDTFGKKEAGLINFADPDAMNWWAGLLGGLMSTYGIDGFKFDAGEANWFPPGGVTSGYLSSNQYADFYITINKHVPAMEFRSGWFAQDSGQIMREYDKDSTWDINNGLQSALTQMFALELIGYPFVLPDMIGGNAYTGYPSSELYIRWVEMNAFMPLMQFSITPWNQNISGYTTQTTTDISKHYTGIHQSLLTYMMGLAQSSAQTGMPMVKPLFFDYPSDQNTYTIDDEFLLGDKYLVCPVFTAGATSRDVYLPSGTWTDYFTGGTFTGPATLKNYPAPLNVIPVFLNKAIK